MTNYTVAKKRWVKVGKVTGAVLGIAFFGWLFAIFLGVVYLSGGEPRDWVGGDEYIDDNVASFTIIGIAEMFFYGFMLLAALTS